MVFTEGEQRRIRQKEKKDNEEHRLARSGELDSMPRLAIEGKKVGEARRNVVEEASQARSDRAKPKERRRRRRRGGNGTKRSKGVEERERRGEQERISILAPSRRR